MRIESDGTIRGTKVMHDNGEEMKGVAKLTLEFDATGDFVTAYVTMLAPKLKLKIKDNDVVVTDVIYD